HRLWRAVAGWAALYGQGGDARDRARQRPPAALAGAVPAALHRGLEDYAHGGRQHRPVRPLCRKQQDRRPLIYACLKPSFCGRAHEHEAKLAAQVTKAVTETLRSSEASASIAIEDVDLNGWAETVYNPDVLAKPGTLYKKPGYNPL